MKNYILRDISPDLWREFKSRCAAEGISIREWVLSKIREYINQPQ